MNLIKAQETAVSTKTKEVSKEQLSKTFDAMSGRVIELKTKMKEAKEFMDAAAKEVYDRLKLTELTQTVKSEDKQLKSILKKAEEWTKKFENWQLKLIMAKRKSLDVNLFLEQLISVFSEIDPDYKEMIELLRSEYTKYPDLQDIDNLKITLKEEKTKAMLGIESSFADKFKGWVSKLVDAIDNIWNKFDNKMNSIDKIFDKMDSAPQLVEKTAGQKLESRDWKAKLNLSFLKDYSMGDKEATDEDSAELGKKVSEAITTFLKGIELSIFEDEAERNEVVGQLEDLANLFTAIEDIEEFDYNMKDLYDLGDDYSIWINTMSEPTKSSLKIETMQAGDIIQFVDIEEFVEEKLKKDWTEEKILKSLKTAFSNKENWDEFFQEGYDYAKKHIEKVKKESSLNKKAEGYDPASAFGPGTEVPTPGADTSESGNGEVNHKQFIIKYKEDNGNWKVSDMTDDLEAAKAQAQKIYNDEKKKAKVIDTNNSKAVFVIGAQEDSGLSRIAALDKDIDQIEKDERAHTVGNFNRLANQAKNNELETYFCNQCHGRLGERISSLPKICPRCNTEVKVQIIK